MIDSEIPIKVAEGEWVKSFSGKLREGGVRSLDYTIENW